MKKLLVIIRREYVSRVRTKAFVVSTVMMPLLIVLSGVLPGLLFSLKTGATRLAVLDETGRLYEPVRESLLAPRRRDRGGERPAGDERGAGGTIPVRGVTPEEREAQMREVGRALGARYEIEPVKVDGRARDEVVRELNARVLGEELDGYLVLPRDILESNRAEFYSRNTSDIITREQIEAGVSRAVVEQRMRDARIDRERVRELSREVEIEAAKVKESGVERDTGGSFGLAMGIGIFIYAALLLYGQVILQSVVEEKTTRISEVLFSSVNAFQLMMGKLVGVSLVGITQLAIWGAAFAALAGYGVAAAASRGVDFALPSIPPSFVVYALLFFLVGFLMYATIFVLVGSMVTSEKEAGQLAMPVIFLSVFSVYLIFPVIRSPSSPLAFWISIAPFFSPVTMLVRIVTDTPPFWQIALSLAVGVATTVGLTWVAARIYRTGMLMYGKSATIPEVLRWIRRA
ncbi:MAG TPA: ABC transporter permease [Thermoanaerobaculia bacterium]|nr:ABC transporter permease [Thermoanaerobaculia bacterium]